MPVEVIFPKVDMDMESGVLSEWLCADGDTVKEGQPIFVIETDKSAMEIEASVSGRIAIGESEAGIQHHVGKLLAYIYQQHELLDDEPVLNGAAGNANDLNREADRLSNAVGAPVETIKPVLSKPSLVSNTTASQAITTINTITAAAGIAGEAGSDRVRASPAARRIAAEYNIPLSTVPGSARKGRIVKADVLAQVGTGGYLATVAQVSGAGQVSDADLTQSTHLQAANQTHHAKPDSSSPPTSVVRQASDDGSVTRVPHSQMRRAIADRLTASVQNIPSYQIVVDCCCDSLLTTSAELNSGIAKEIVEPACNGGVSLNIFFIRALALALNDVRAANCQWAENEILLFDRVDVGIAVAVEGGLITPVLKSVEGKSLLQIAADARVLIERAKKGALLKSEYCGGVTTVSNLGMYGIPEFTSIINPPQSSILSVGAVEQRAVADNGQIQIKSMCRVTFTFDHRVIDGAVGARVASRFKEYVECSVRLLL